ITTAATWNFIEAWTATLTTLPTWGIVETWTGTIAGPATWQIAESWTALIRTLGPPTLYSPANGTLLNDNTPTFDWSDVPGATEYQIMVDNDPDFLSPEINTFVTTSYYTTPAPGLSDENYFWRVRSKDGVLLSPWSDNWSFIIDTVPAPAPTLLQPENGSTVWVDRPTFRWTFVTEPNVTYRLTIDNDQEFSSPIYNKPNLVDNWHQLENALTENFSPYYWRVASIDNAGNENWSGWFIFYLRVPPASAVAPISPYWNSTSITLTATASDNDGAVENVELWYRWSEDNQNWSAWHFFGLDNDSSNGWSWTFTFDNGNGFYQFYSRARDDRGNYEDAPPVADASCGYDITPPTMPSLISPENNSTVRESYGKPTFSWTASTDNYGAFTGSGVTYRLIVDNDNDFLSPIYLKEGITENTHTLENSLPEDNYHWMVVAIDGAGNENASYWFRFTLRVPPVSSVSPITPYWRTSEPITITATASDNDGSVNDVELWYRYSSDNSSWSAWIFWDHDTSPPYTFSFYPPSGEGFYQFYSRARDDRGNYEDAPPVADASCGYDVTPPETPAPALPENNSTIYTRTPTLEWSFISDLSGVTYELILDNDPTFSSPYVYHKIGLLENLHTLENSLELGDYWWKVGAWDGANHFSGWSGYFSFTVARRWNNVETWTVGINTPGIT
ncbi:MAG: Ig-like domain-containing protein, partial [Candidatus Hadarchaeales archaeon]